MIPSNAIYRAGCDPSELHAGGNGFAFAIVAGYFGEVAGERAPRFDVLVCHEWRHPTSLPQVFNSMERFGATFPFPYVGTDQFSKGALIALAARSGVDLRYVARTAQQRQQDWENLVQNFDLGAVTIPDDQVLVGDLLAARRVTLPGGGFRCELLHSNDGRHGDKAAAMELALSSFRNTPLYGIRTTPRIHVHTDAGNWISNGEFPNARRMPVAPQSYSTPEQLEQFKEALRVSEPPKPDWFGPQETVRRSY